jgi:hypothetical protein
MIGEENLKVEMSDLFMLDAHWVGIRVCMMWF